MGTATDEDNNNLALDNPTKSGQEIKPLSKKLKYLTATSIFFGAITFGCAYNTYGPVITSLQHKYETDDATISTVFSILTGGYMVGGLCAGIIYDHVNRQLAVITILCTISAVMFVTPFCPTLTTFFISAAVMGICCGAYDAAQIVWIMEMLQEECPPFVMGQHFFYAVGTNVATLVMAPFLDEDEEDDPTTTTTTTSSIYMGDHNLTSAAKKEESGSDNKLFVPYIIFGVLVAASAVAQILLFIFLRYHAPPRKANALSEKEQLEKEEEEGGVHEAKLEIFGVKIWSFPKIRFVFLTACFFGAYQGMEMCTFQFFPKFAQNSELALTESESAYALTGMLASFAVGRGVAIIAVFKIPSQIVLCGNIVLVAVANVILVSWANSSLPMLWTCSILFGLGFSSMYPAICAYVERYLIFTNFIGSLMIVCGSGVAAIYPLIVGNSIEDNPIVLSYTTFFSIGLVVFALGSLSFLTHRNKTRY